ncbi:MAG TPA: zf-TFIIB domain-containing protein [Nocardioides sp.]
MQCPTDGAVLVMSERSGIEIDYCPTCRGVWLDRGELDKIIERSLDLQGPAPAAPAPPAPAPQNAAPQQQQRYVDRSYDSDDRGRSFDRGSYQPGYGQPYRKKRKESWLSELFD